MYSYIWYICEIVITNTSRNKIWRNCTCTYATEKLFLSCCEVLRPERNVNQERNVSIDVIHKILKQRLLVIYALVNHKQTWRRAVKSIEN